MRNFLRSSFGSALLGGAVVAAFGLVAIASGLVQSQDTTTTTVAEPLAAPIDVKDSSSNVVNQIYRRDGQGVAFIQATKAPEEPAVNPFGEPQGGGGVATGSGFLIDTEGHIVTNNHVVEGATKVEVKLGSENATHTAEVIGADPASDVALLKVDLPADQLHPLAL